MNKNKLRCDSVINDSLTTESQRWVSTTLGEIGDFKNGINKDKEAFGKGIPFVNLNDVFGHSSIRNPNLSLVDVSQKEIQEYSLKAGDILFVRSSVKPTGVGLTSLVEEDLPQTVYSGFLIRFRQSKGHLINDFAKHYFLNYQFRKAIIRKSTISANTNINQQALKKLAIHIPPKDQQQKIANILSVWDDAIEKTEKLITAKQKQFEWLRNKLMNNDFKNCRNRLSDMAKISIKKNITSAEGLHLLTVKLHCKGIQVNNRNIRVTLSKTGRPYYQHTAGSFLIGRQNFHNGGFGIVPPELDGYISSNAITSLSIDETKLSPKYLFYYFSRKNYYLRISHLMDGTGQKEISDKQIMKLPISAISLAQQKKITQTLDAAQNEINILKQQMEQYRKQKHGLMQKLLPNIK